MEHPRGRGRGVKLSAPMVRDHDPLRSTLERPERVIGSDDPLHADREARLLDQPLEVSPAERGVKLALDILSERRVPLRLIEARPIRVDKIPHRQPRRQVKA